MLVLLDDRPISVIAFTVRDGLITEMRSFSDPDRLAQIVPSWVA
jgi:ketosteroid isomerase-like protein